MTASPDNPITPTSSVPKARLNTDALTRRIRELQQSIGSAPSFELVQVITSTPNSSCIIQKIGTTTQIPAIVVGWSGSQWPIAGDYVWTLTLEPGAQPFIVGKPSPNKPRIKIYMSSTVGALNNVITTLSFPTSAWSYEYKQGITHDPTGVSTPASRIIMNEPGIYLVSAGIAYASNTTGARGVRVLLNGATELQFPCPAASPTFFDTHICTTFPSELFTNDYLEMQYYQNSGTNPLNMITGPCKTYLSVEKTADLG